MPISAQIVQATVDFVSQKFARPLRLSSGLITEVTQATASVRVRIGTREAVGLGSIYLSDLWSWPDPSLPREQRDADLRALCTLIAAELPEVAGGRPDHPLTLGLRLHDAAHEAGARSTPAIPALASAMAMSPFDAAIHDAAGKILKTSAFSFYDEPFHCEPADRYFRCGSAQRAIRETILPSPRTELDAWLIVGKDDALPDAMAPWVRERGYRCFKLKTLGKDPEADALRTAAVYDAARSLGIEKPRLSIDSNEANPDAQSVIAFLHRTRDRSPGTFDAIEYLEQPTARDIRKHAFDYAAVAAIKPVLLDEGLTGLDLLDDAEAQRWSGLALKTCKGHSIALAAAAWAKERGMLLAMQDLTNPGLSLIHSALMAARLPTINGVELNSPQFTPAANAPWLPRLASLIEPTDGRHHLPAGPTIGLGSDL